LFPDDGVSRPAALLFHGLTGAPDEMRPLADLLHSKGFDILTPCLSGHATTVAELKKTTASAWLKDADRAFEEIGKRKPKSLYCAGLSFGGLLTLALAIKHSNISALAVMAPPTTLRSAFRENGLELFSYLPDPMLNLLGCVAKKNRDVQFLGNERVAYNAHSIAAVSRAKQIQRQIWEDLNRVQCPVMLLQDPEDHHVAKEGLAKLQQQLSGADVTIGWIPGAEHEMTVGPKAEEVNSRIVQFFLDIESKDKRCPER